MTFPDFSEFSFGYAVVREIESLLGGRLAVPAFPTQPEEATKGYDVDFLGHGVPLFVQFKRSDVLTRASCRERKGGHMASDMPIYRMNLHRKDGYKQHFLMRGLESEGNLALYCTSQVPDKQSLDAHYNAGTTLQAAAFFSPNEINLPDTHEIHHVSFYAESTVAYLFSTSPVLFDRKFTSFDSARAKLRPRADQELDEAVGRLSRWVNAVNERGAAVYAEDQRRKYGEESGVARRKLRVASDAFVQTLTPLEQPAALEWDRIRKIDSVVKRAALIAYYEMDSFLLSVSKESLLK